MDASRRTLPLRRVAMMAALAALTLPAGPAEAAKRKPKPKPPVITSVSPMQVAVGDTLTLKGRHFRKGKGRNSVGFKRDGAAVVFVKADIATRRMMTVKVPAKLEDQLTTEATQKVPTRFRLRVLTSRFGRAFTPARLSPVVSARAAEPGEPGAPPSDLGPNETPSAPPAGAPDGDCDGDKTLNAADGDDDNDNLTDALENQIGTDGCKADSDGDGVVDGYEYRSAIDLNDDEYQQPDTALPFPGKRPYPNPLDGGDAGADHDGDGLTLAHEYGLWKFTTPSPGPDAFAQPAGAAASPLSYSAGLQYSASVYCRGGAPAAHCGADDDNRRVPSLPAAGYAKWDDFIAWAQSAGRGQVKLRTDSQWYDHKDGREAFDLRDADLSHSVSPVELFTLDEDADGYLSDDERDEDADGLGNFDELRGRMQPGYWTSCYKAEPADTLAFAGTNVVDADSDGDGVRDGADDQDHDDFPNVMELSRFAASSYQFDETDDGVRLTTSGGGPLCVSDPDLKADELRHADAYGQVNPFNRCLPDVASRTCPRRYEVGSALPAPFGGPKWWALQ